MDLTEMPYPSRFSRIILILRPSFSLNKPFSKSCTAKFEVKGENTEAYSIGVWQETDGDYRVSIP